MVGCDVASGRRGVMRPVASRVAVSRVWGGGISQDIEDRDRTIASLRQRLAGAPSNDAAARAQSSDVDMNAGAGAGAGAGASSASAAAAGGLLGLIGRAATSMSPAKPKAPATGSRQ